MQNQTTCKSRCLVLTASTLHKQRRACTLSAPPPHSVEQPQACSISRSFMVASSCAVVRAGCDSHFSSRLLHCDRSIDHAARVAAASALESRSFSRPPPAPVSSAQVDSRRIKRSRMDERTATAASASSCGASTDAELPPQPARCWGASVATTQQRPPVATSAGSYTAIDQLTTQQESRLRRHWSRGPLRDHP